MQQVNNRASARLSIVIPISDQRFGTGNPAKRLPVCIFVVTLVVMMRDGVGSIENHHMGDFG